MTYAFTFAALHSGRAGKHQGQEGFSVARMEDQGTWRLVCPLDKPDTSPGPAFLSFQHIWAKPSLCSHTSLRNTDTWFGHLGRWGNWARKVGENTRAGRRRLACSDSALVPWRAHSFMPPERGGAWEEPSPPVHLCARLSLSHPADSMASVLWGLSAPHFLPAWFISFKEPYLKYQTKPSLLLEDACVTSLRFGSHKTPRPLAWRATSFSSLDPLLISSHLEMLPNSLPQLKTVISQLRGWFKSIWHRRSARDNFFFLSFLPFFKQTQFNPSENQDQMNNRLEEKGPLSLHWTLGKASHL